MAKARGKKKIIYRHALVCRQLQGYIFKVKNTMIDGYDFCFEVVKDLVDKYLSGVNLDTTLFMKWGIKKVRAGKWFYGCKTEQEVLERRRRVIELYDYFDANGYSPLAALDWDQRYSCVTWPISVRFDDQGQIIVCDGFHRLSIMKLLGIVVDVDCIITNSRLALDTERTGITKGDFPLDDVLREINSGENLYQPNNDPRCEGWTLWRQDCDDRLELILPKIRGPVVLDIGSAEGWFSRAFAKEGHKVYGLDTGKQRIAVSRYLATKENLDIYWVHGNWIDYVPRIYFDTIVMLSVWHHDIIANGITKALEDLKVFRRSCKRLIIETPLSSKKVSWLKKEGHDDNSFKFTPQQLKKILEEQTKMKVYQITPDFIGRGMFFFLEA